MFGRAPRLRQESLLTKVGWDVLGWGKVGGKANYPKSIRKNFLRKRRRERGGEAILGGWDQLRGNHLLHGKLAILFRFILLPLLCSVRGSRFRAWENEI